MNMNKLHDYFHETPQYLTTTFTHSPNNFSINILAHLSTSSRKAISSNNVNVHVNVRSLTDL